jgi:hypothetical protein
MKLLLIILSVLTLNAHAEINSKFGSGKAIQIFIGSQPNDRATSHIDLKVGIETTSDFDGIQSVIGYEFLCNGDPFPNKEQVVDSTSSKALNLKFAQATPLYFAQWASDGALHNCQMSWSVASVGTKNSSGGIVGFNLTGVFGGITIELTDLQVSPDFKKAKAANSLFTVIKEPNCI